MVLQLLSSTASCKMVNQGNKLYLSKLMFERICKIMGFMFKIMHQLVSEHLLLQPSSVQNWDCFSISQVLESIWKTISDKRSTIWYNINRHAPLANDEKWQFTFSKGTTPKNASQVAHEVDATASLKKFCRGGEQKRVYSFLTYSLK